MGGAFALVLIIIIVLLILLMPIVGMLVEGYLRGQRAEVLKAAVQRGVMDTAELKEALLKERRGDPAGNLKAGLILLAVGFIFLVWGGGELIAIKHNPKLIALPGLRISILPSTEDASLNSLFCDNGNTIGNPSNLPPPQYDKMKAPDLKPGDQSKDNQSDVDQHKDRLKKFQKYFEDKYGKDFRRDFKRDIPNFEEYKKLPEEQKKAIHEWFSKKFTEGKSKFGSPKGNNPFTSHLPRPHKMVIVEAPGLPLIALNKLFIGTLSAMLGIMLLVIHAVVKPK